MDDLMDNGSLHSLPTVAMPKAPTLPGLLASQVKTEKHLANIERAQWYLLALFLVQEILVVAIVGGVAYLIGHLQH